MIEQPWLQSSDWFKDDVKLKELEANPIHLPHFDSLVENIPASPGIFTIFGARQVGKSTFLRFLAKRLLKSIAPKQMALVDGDLIETWKDLLSILTGFLDHAVSSDSLSCLLIDEVTSIEDWHRAIKHLADKGRLKTTLVVLTGSSQISLKSGGELFPGRRGRHAHLHFLIHPVSYRDVAKHLSLSDYFKVGGLPWAINEFLRLKVVPEYVGEIYWSWLKGEFIKRGRSEWLLRHLVSSLSKRLGTGLSHNKLAQEVGISSNDTARQYLELLQDCFAIHEIFWMDPSEKIISPKKNRKYYPVDPLLHHLFSASGSLGHRVFSSPLSSEEEGKLAEIVVCQELKRRYSESLLAYWMGKKEVDFVSEAFGGIEVKYQNRVHPEELAWFEKVFPKKPLIVLTKNDRFFLGKIRGLPLREWLIESEQV